MIQDILPRKFDIVYRPAAKPADGSYICIKCRGKMLLKDGDEIIMPTFGEVRHLNLNYTYLFSIDGDTFFYADDESGIELEGYSYKGSSTFRKITPKHMAFAGITAHQITQWYGANKFCPKCGAKLHHDEKERMMKCGGCGFMIFPRINPSVIVAVTNGDKLLMTLRTPTSDHHSLVAGFVEVGESFEDTVRREVMEETGVKIKNLKYYKSQPWSFSDSLLAGYFAELDGDDKITVQKEELFDAQWVARSDIKEEFTDSSMTNEMICLFKDGREPR